MDEIMNENDPRFVRDLNFQPREKWAGHWRRGRLYPLYNVVENNGSFFVSQSGKTKAEPYVVYNETTGEFSANEGWKLKQLSADSRISAQGGGGGGGVTPEQVQEMIARKQDVISDLATIRSGAAAGASAYKKPNGGIPKSDLSSAVKASLDNADLVDTKQDTIEDLSTIRSGAAAGATAYQKPSSGVPKTDLASGVQTSLGKADTAYQRPASGIPASDIASGVIPDVSGKQDKLVSGDNIKTVNGETILGSGNITAGDPNAVKYVAQTLTDAQKTQACSNIGAAAASVLSALETAIAAKYSKPSGGIPETDLASGVQSALALARTSIQSLADYYSKTEVDALIDAVGSEQYVDVTTLPTASASTLGKIYLVGPDANGFYDRYYTSYDGSTYSWVAAGNTEINLANYATKSEVSQLQQEVNSLPRGKNYGFFTTSADLPADATEEGFAYVGATEPYAIWTFDGDNWTDSGVSANAFNANEEQVKDSVDEYLEEHPTITGTFNNSAKRALIALLEKVAYIDGNGQSYLAVLNAALNDIPIDHIEAVFTQDTWKCYDIYSLDELRSRLVVTAYYVDGTVNELSDYELSGTLSAGNSTITVTAEGQTDTFDVTVIGTVKLYMEGDECVAITGGWQTKGFNLTNGTPSKTKEASDLLIKFATSVSSGGAAGSWSTINKIDLTGLSRIIVELEAYNASGRVNLWGYWPSTLAEGTTQTAAYGSDYSSNRVSIYTLGATSNPDTYPFPNPPKELRRILILGTARTQAYLSINLNGFTDGGAQYSAGAYVKIKKVVLAAQ